MIIEVIFVFHSWNKIEIEFKIFPNQLHHSINKTNSFCVNTSNNKILILKEFYQCNDFSYIPHIGKKDEDLKQIRKPILLLEFMKQLWDPSV